MKGRLNALATDAYEQAEKSGFHDKPIELGTRLMLIASELAEVLEADREDRYGSHDDAKAVRGFHGHDYERRYNEVVKGTVPDELADVLIRTLELCALLNIDVDMRVAMKMRYNALREHKHGKKY